MLYPTAAIGRGEIHITRVADGQEAIPPIPMPSSGRLTATISLGRDRWRPGGGAIVFVGIDARGRTALFEQTFTPGKDTSASRRLLKRSDHSLSVEGRARTAVSNSSGRYRLEGIPAGTHRADVRLLGFATRRTEMKIVAAQDTSWDVVIGVGRRHVASRQFVVAASTRAND